MCLKICRLLIILENSEKRRSPMITVSINMPNNTNRYLNPTNGNSSELGYGTMQHTNPITQFHPNTCQIHQNSVSQPAAQPPSPSAGRNLGEIRESSLSLSLSSQSGDGRCADYPEITKSHSRLGYPLAARRQTFKSASPLEVPTKGERIVRARSLRHCRPSFLPMPAGCTWTVERVEKRVAPSRK